MKILLSLTAFSFTLALCQGGYCEYSDHEAEMKDGQPVLPTECTDSYDGSKHPFGSKWNTAECMECTCDESGMDCCTRYGLIAEVPGCKAVLNPNTCEYEFYKLDDPSKPCF
ncbi:small serum protein 2-like isoform X3 [Lacerta agilis]|uniref:small serum protein 2-like isoform X2 n=1 Tax=Lacerta agilis TaxID=80427 RepID=UPI00141A5080|nr:small serum protein 2-like isoform X2 [Lacerta agilis]XP_033014917.1 small serum protein 2-like isoform X3 [Lacerta agilis]